MKDLEWVCRRCRTSVDMQKFRCNCSDGPSPWEPVLVNHRSPYECYWSRRALAAEMALKEIERELDAAL